jgi:hypothetical protein
MSIPLGNRDNGENKEKGELGVRVEETETGECGDDEPNLTLYIYIYICICTYICIYIFIYNISTCAYLNHIK